MYDISKYSEVLEGVSMNSMKRILKSDKEIKKACEEEMTRRYDEVSRDVAYQTFAMVFMVLNRDYGFGKKRLHDLKDAIEFEYYKMQEKPLGVKYDPDDVIRICKDRFGIDFNESQFKKE